MDDIHEFMSALDRTFAFEGGFVDDPNDRGGMTKYGVTHGTWNAFRAMLGSTGASKLPESVRDITREMANHVYLRMYWDTLRCGELLDQWLAARVFDAGVNHGTGRSGKMLQVAYNLLRPDDWPELKVDGKIGARTLECVNRMSSKYGDALRGAFNGERWGYYKSIVQNDPSQRRYLRGQAKRCT